MEELEYISADQETRSIFEMRNKQLNDIQNGLQIKFKEGKEEGLAEGKLEEKFDIAKNLLKLKLPIEQIIQATGLNLDDINELRV